MKPGTLKGRRGAHKNAKSKMRNAARKAERKANPELRGRQWRGLLSGT